MADLCKPGYYGPCKLCKKNVVLVLKDGGTRLTQEFVDRFSRGWFCQDCIKARSKTWNPTDKVVIDYFNNSTVELSTNPVQATDNSLLPKELQPAHFAVKPSRTTADPHDAEKTRSVDCKRDQIFAYMAR